MKYKLSKQRKEPIPHYRKNKSRENHYHYE
nr:MAG TPA: hypothetical protein [Caudoviricetes sp.]